MKVRTATFHLTDYTGIGQWVDNTRGEIIDVRVAGVGQSTIFVMVLYTEDANKEAPKEDFDRTRTLVEQKFDRGVITASDVRGTR